MFSLSNPEHRNRFWRAYDVSWDLMKPFRTKRTLAISRYVGSEYGERLSKMQRKILVNHSLALVSTYSFMLSANRPQVTIETPYSSLRGFALKYETATNNLLDEINAQQTFQDIVEDALFGIGLARVFFAPGNPMEIPNPNMPPEPHPSEGLDAQMRYRAAVHAMPHSIQIDAGKPAFERMSLDDCCLDMPSRSWEKMRWITYSYRVPLDEARMDERFSPEVREQLMSDSKWGGDDVSERASSISHTSASSDSDDLEDMVTLMDVYLPKEGRWAIMSKKQKDLSPLLEDDWDGPETGPFTKLSFYNVPDNIMPVSLAATLGPIIDSANELRRKNTLDALNQKTILAYQGDGRDAENVVAAQHMQPVRMSNVQAVREMHFNGVDQGTAAAMGELENAFSRAAGNLDAMAGLGPQSSTFGQDKLIKDSNNTMVQRMGDRVRSFANGVVYNLAWMLWVDSTKRIQGQVKIPGVSNPIDLSWTAEEREGDFFQYNFNVETDSMRYKSPEEKLQEINSLLTQVYIPSLPLIQQAGGTLNWQLLADYQAKILRVPMLRELVEFDGSDTTLRGPIYGQPPEQRQQSAPAAVGRGGSTHREYVRQSQAQQPDPMQAMIAAAGNRQQPQAAQPQGF